MGREKIKQAVILSTVEGGGPFFNLGARHPEPGRNSRPA